MGEKHPCVYILASKPNGTIYVGVTSDLLKRVHEHKTGVIAGFTKRYRVHDLVCFEMCESMIAAIEREKQIKKWERAWKTRLIRKANPQWRDLWAELFQWALQGWIPACAGMTAGVQFPTWPF